MTPLPVRGPHVPPGNFSRLRFRSRAKRGVPVTVSSRVGAKEWGRAPVPGKPDVLRPQGFKGLTVWSVPPLSFQRDGGERCPYGARSPPPPGVSEFRAGLVCRPFLRPVPPGRTVGLCSGRGPRPEVPQCGRRIQPPRGRGVAPSSVRRGCRGVSTLGPWSRSPRVCTRTHKLL